jgi:pimeloyl-ACP methyl ester carboxylesterase
VIAAVLRRKPASGRSDAVEDSVEMFRLIGSPGYEFDEGKVRDFAERSYDRGYDPAGGERQLAAVMAQRDRTKHLARLAAPTLVMHGLQDPLVAPSGGLALARAIPRARFIGFHGMGHDLPEALWPDFVTEIAAIARRGSLSQS